MTLPEEDRKDPRERNDILKSHGEPAHLYMGKRCRATDAPAYKIRTEEHASFGADEGLVQN